MRLMTTSPRWQFGLCLSMILSATIVGMGRFPLLADQEAEQDPTEPGMLVLTTGRVVSGRILRNGRDFLVKTPTGQMFVPATLVRLRSTNIQDAYRQLRLAFPENHGAESHMALARWCITQKLYSDARQELKDALLMEPDRVEAQDMLQRLNSMLDPATVEKPEAPLIVEATRATTRLEEVESLGGLPHELAIRYTSRIQPLLNNHCALAGCHGFQEESREFRLQKFSTGDRASRHTAERNLASIFRHIDLESPRESPLLIKPKGNHGRRGKSIFVGTRGAEQYAELRDWVVNVAASREQPGSGSGRKVTSRRGNGKIRMAAHARTASESKSDEAESPEPDLFPELNRGRRNNQNSNAEQKAPATAPESDERESPANPPAAKDPFDPAEFNRETGK